MSTPANPADLLAFIRAQLAARERAAHLIKQHGLANLLPAAIINSNGATVFFTDDAYTLISDHLGPDALLADVDAKRRILDLYEPTLFGDLTRLSTLEEIIGLLALPFADHPDYREEWRPA